MDAPFDNDPTELRDLVVCLITASIHNDLPVMMSLLETLDPDELIPLVTCLVGYIHAHMELIAEQVDADVVEMWRNAVIAAPPDSGA